MDNSRTEKGKALVPSRTPGKPPLAPESSAKRSYLRPGSVALSWKRCQNLNHRGATTVTVGRKATPGKAGSSSSLVAASWSGGPHPNHAASTSNPPSASQGQLQASSAGRESQGIAMSGKLSLMDVTVQVRSRAFPPFFENDRSTD